MCVQESKSEADVPVVVLNNITAYWDKVKNQHTFFEYKPYYYFKQKAYRVLLITISQPINKFSAAQITLHKERVDVKRP